MDCCRGEWGWERHFARLSTARQLVRMPTARAKLLAKLKAEKTFGSFRCAAAAPDRGDQAVPADGEAPGRQVRENQEDGPGDQVQGPVLQVSVHAVRGGQRQGRQAQAVTAPG